MATRALSPLFGFSQNLSCVSRNVSIIVLALLLASCGGAGGEGTVLANCKRGLISGFGLAIGDEKIGSVTEQEGQGGEEGDGSVGNGEGIGMGGSLGQYAQVDVTVELANGGRFGPWPIDSTKGMVTYVHCGGVLPAKITFEGKAADASYYDEGLRRNVPFFGQTQIGLLTDYEKNVGITPLTEALYERAMQIGRQRGVSEGWKDQAIIAQAHSELLSIANDQFPSIYRLTDLNRLPILLNADNDQPGSETLPANQNGLYAADIAGLALAGAAALPASGQPALEVAQTLAKDLADGQLDLSDVNGQPLAKPGKIPYTFDTLWSAVTVGAGQTAVRNGRDQLATDAVPIGFVRSRAAPGNPGPITETLYVLGSNGDLIANLNPSVNGGEATKPAANRAFTQLYRFGLEPVVALRSDGQGLLVFPTSWDGSASFEVSPPSPSVTMVQMFDAGYPVIRMSDGSQFRLQGTNLVPEPVPVGTVSQSCRDEYDGALPNAGNGELGTSNGRVCYGLNASNELRVWRPNGVPSGRVIDLGRIKQVSGNEQVTIALGSDGSLFQLDHDHSVQFRDAGGNLVDTLTGGEVRELLFPGANPLPIEAPRICWGRAPFVTACDGTAYQLEYREYLDTQGRFQGAGLISGLKPLPIPAPVWRPLVNRQITVGEVVLGTDSVFVGTDGLVYDLEGRILELPLDGAPQQREDQAPLAPTVGAVAVDDVLDRNESESPLVITGSAQPGSTVVVTLGSQQQQAIADGTGRWLVTFATTELPQTDGPVPLQVVATNSNGSSAPTNRTVNVFRSLPATPSINAVEGNDTVTAAEAADGVTLSGSGSSGSSIQVAWGGQSKTTNVDAGGNWSVTFGPAEVPAPADTQVSVAASNLNGNSEAATRSVRVLPAPPLTPQIATVAGNNRVSPEEAAAGVNVSGTGSPGSQLAIDWAGVPKSVTADDAGNWTVLYSSAELPSAGTTRVTARASNSAGESEQTVLVVEIEPPEPEPPQAPTIDPVTGDNIVTNQERLAGIVVAGSAPAGARIRVTWDNVTLESQSDDQSRWSVPFAGEQIPSEGPSTIRVTATNDAGQSPAAVQSVTIESATPPMPLPGRPTISSVSGDNQVSLLERRSSVEIAGTAESGAVVTVRWGSNELSGDTNSSGLWRIVFFPESLPPAGSTVLSAVATTIGGTSGETTLTIPVLDAPSIPIITYYEPTVQLPVAQAIVFEGESDASTVIASWGQVTNQSPVTDGQWTVSFDPNEVPPAGTTLFTIYGLVVETSGADAEVAIEVKPAATGALESKITSMQLENGEQVPSGSSIGEYTGTVTLTGTVSQAFDPCCFEVLVYRNGTILKESIVLDKDEAGAWSWSIETGVAGIFGGFLNSFTSAVRDSNGQTGPQSDPYSVNVDGAPGCADPINYPEFC